MTWLAGEGSWGQPGLLGRAIGDDQACRGGQIGAIGPVRGNQAGRRGQLGAFGPAREQLGVIRLAEEWLVGDQVGR